MMSVSFQEAWPEIDHQPQAEFTGKPPAGEAGMCFCEGEWWKYWNGARWFNGNSSSIAKAWEAFEQGHTVNFVVHHARWATLPELLASGLTEAEALPMLHRSQLPAKPADAWVPPQQEGFSEWREHDGNGCPMEAASADIALLMRNERAKQFYRHVPDDYSPHIEDTSDFWRNVVAYCVKLEDQPSQAEVESTQKPQSPADDAADAKADEAARMTDPDKPMKDRDAIKKAVAASTVKDEVWREYDPKYPPIQPYPMEFKKTGNEQDGFRHFYRRLDEPAADLGSVAILHEHRTDKFGRCWGWGRCDENGPRIHRRDRERDNHPNHEDGRQSRSMACR